MRDVRVAIVGAGFSGLGMAIRLKQAGMDHFVVLERGDDVGGTWRDNVYPGCQCDVPSHLYSFSFAPNPAWSRTYSCQPEIQAYLQRCAREFGVLPHVRFRSEVQSAAWDEGKRRWRVETPACQLCAQVLVAAPGALSEPRIPELPGLDSFERRIFHSAQWDHDHDLTGKRVAAVGTGASTIQFVPRIQPEVERLHLFQRTPPWILPHTDRPVSRLERRLYARFPRLQWLVRSGVYWAREGNVLGFVYDQRLMRMAERLARWHLRRQVPDRVLRRKLRPSYRLGCKRVLLSNDYYPALVQPNVEVVPSAIAEVRPRSVVAADGTEREIDAIIFGTGFFVTDMPSAAYIRGRGGQTLAEKWRGSPQAYMGTSIAGFPNLFMLLGPNTGLGHTSVVFMIEAQIAHVMEGLRTMQAQGLESVEVRADVQETFNAEVQQRLAGAVWSTGGCASWYTDATGRNTTLWPDFTWRFWQRARGFDPADYVLETAQEPGPVRVAA